MQSSYLHRFRLEQQSPSFQRSSNERISEQKTSCASETLNSHEDDKSAWEQEAVGFGPLWSLYDMWI